MRQAGPISPNSVVIDHERLMSRRSMAVGETPWATAPSRQQLQPIDDHPDRRDCGPAHICEHLAPRRRQDHLDREIAIVWRAIQLAGEVKARGERRRVRSDWTAVESERDISVDWTRRTTRILARTFTAPGPRSTAQ